MEVILLENILNLGNIGDKVKVKNGYGRNYLLKQGKALRFNSENQSFVEKKKDELNKKNNEIKNKYKEISKIVNNKTFIFKRESKDNGDLYGSIKPKEITNLIFFTFLITTTKNKFEKTTFLGLFSFLGLFLFCSESHLRTKAEYEISILNQIPKLTVIIVQDKPHEVGTVRALVSSIPLCSHP